MEHYSTIKRNELLMHTTEMNLRGIMLSERNQSQKVAYYVISPTWHSEKDKVRGMEARSVATKG